MLKTDSGEVAEFTVYGAERTVNDLRSLVLGSRSATSGGMNKERGMGQNDNSRAGARELVVAGQE